MKVFFKSKPDPRNLFKAISGSVCATAPLESEEDVTECRRALQAWIDDTPIEFSRSHTDSFGTDGISFKGDTLVVWVLNSCITIKKMAEWGEFEVSAEGARTSFAVNNTGDIGRHFWHHRQASEILLETEAKHPWDTTGDPFIPTLITRVKHSHEVWELAIIAQHDSVLLDALVVIRERLTNPDPRVCQKLLEETGDNYPMNFWDRGWSAEAIFENKENVGP